MNEQIKPGMRLNQYIASCGICSRREADRLIEAGRVLVNGVETDFRLCPPYRFDLGEDLKEGRNEIVIETVNTPLRDVLNYDQGMFGYEKGVYEPSGLFGRISLIKME